jgi:predicted  nucleic acid-binding Zn-ribbon protein
MNDQAISALQALVNTLTDQQKGLQGNIDALNEAIKALQEGGVVAQTAIDQAVSEQVTAALAPVQTAVSSTLTSLNAKINTSLPAVGVTDTPAVDSTPTVTP